MKLKSPQLLLGWFLLTTQIFGYQTTGPLKAEDSLYPMLEYSGEKTAWGYVNYRGAVVVPAIYESASDFEDGFGIVILPSPKTEGHTGDLPIKITSGIVDRRGRIRMLPDTIFYGGFSEGLAFAKTKGEWGFVNQIGSIEIPIPSGIFIDETSPLSFEFQDGRAAVNTTNGVYYVYRNGKFVHAKNIIASTGFLNNVESVLVAGGYTIRDSAGKLLVDPQRNPINYSSDGLFLIEVTDGTWRYVNNKGQEILKLSYDYAAPFSNGLALVKFEDKWGFINKGGNLVIENRYDEADSFGEEGVAAVRLGVKYGFIDTTGKLIIDYRFNHIIRPFSRGLALVQCGDIIGYINTSGQWIWKTKLPSTSNHP